MAEKKSSEFLVDTNTLEDMADIIGEEGVRVNLIRFSGAMAYLAMNASYLQNPPKGTAEGVAATAADLYFALTCFICLNADVIVPELEKREKEWKQRAQKQKGPRPPSTTKLQ